MKLKKLKVSCPQMGNYFVAFKELLKILEIEIIKPRKITKKTIEIGTKYSPEFVCVPFKYSLGTFIEAINDGANVLIQSGNDCRLGYYGEVQTEILKSLGYKFILINFNAKNGVFDFYRQFKKINPKINKIQLLKASILYFFKTRAIEKMENIVRKNIGFEVKNGQHEVLLNKFLEKIDNTSNLLKVFKYQKTYTKKFSKIKIKKPKKLIKVGLIGELYMIMEPFTSFELEKFLAKKGVSVSCLMKLSTNFLFKKTKIKYYQIKAKKYASYHYGGHGLSNTYHALKFIKDDFDGIIHVKPFGCMPEISAMPALHRISKDHKIPIIYFSFDSHTSMTGVETRLEAFYDMLVFKQEKNEK